MSEPFIGEVIIFAGTFAPRGWAFCDGQLLGIAGQPALFSILGTTYGGDGRTTFALPDLRGRVCLHSGNSSPLGQRGGNDTTTLNVTNLPAHSHTATVDQNLHVGCSTATNNLTDPTGAVLASGPEIYTENNADVQMSPAAIGGDVTVTNGNAGANQSFSNEQPYLVVNYIIALEGAFPFRD